MNTIVFKKKIKLAMRLAREGSLLVQRDPSLRVGVCRPRISAPTTAAELRLDRHLEGWVDGACPLLLDAALRGRSAGGK